MKNWLKWISISLGAIIIGIGLTLYIYYFVWMRMNSDLVSKANKTFETGITLQDERNDFVMMGTDKEEVMSTDKNNPSPYQVDYLDIKSGQFGADEDYLYFKLSYYGTIPKKPETVNNDRLLNIGNKLHIMSKDGADQVVVHFEFGWAPVVGLPASNTYYDYCPTGIEWPESARMSCHGKDVKIAGGGGTDYIMGALPLAKLGLQKGQTIYIDMDEESKSVQFTHAAVDMLAGEGKSAAAVTWQVGTNNFSLEKNHPLNNKNK